MDCLNKKELPFEEMMPLIIERLSVGGEVKISPKGVSMLPMLRQGKDSVILSPVPETLQKYDLPLYKRDDGKYVLHRIVSVGETLECVGDNHYEIEKNIRKDQIIAVVTAFYRGEKLWKTDNLIYRIYCVLWYKSRKFRKLFKRFMNKITQKSEAKK